jgi:mannose-6-phosphate isomerase-like protein (cupin superfamily)
MYLVRLDNLELPKVGYEDDQKAQVNGTFPFSVATGNQSTAAVYFEVEPGKMLPTHTDSSEELLMILEGEAEITVGDEQAWVSDGDVALVPSMVPHSLRNVGEKKARVIGFFGGNTSLATFEKPLVPLEQPPTELPFGERTLTIPPPVVLERSPAPLA